MTWIAQRPSNGGQFQPQQFTKTAVEMYLAALEREGFSIAHRARVKSALSTFARWLIEEKGVLSKNPTRDIDLPAMQVLAPRQLSEDQRFILRSRVEQEGDRRGAALFALGYWAGCRVSDVSWLEMAHTHVGPKVGWIHVGHKGGKWRCFQKRNACGNWPVIAKQSYRRSKPLKRIEKTRSEPSTSVSKPESDAPVWLQEQVYLPKRQCTIDLVHQSVDALQKDKQRVSLATVAAKSKELDVEGNGKGVSESAIFDNQEARTYYEQHRSWRGSSRKRAKPLAVASPASPGTVKPGRDEQRVRQRYLRMTPTHMIGNSYLQLLLR